MTDDDEKPILIGVEEVTSHEDGSATYTFHMDDRASDNIRTLGLKLVLYCGAANKDIQDVFDYILGDDKE